MGKGRQTEERELALAELTQRETLDFGQWLLTVTPVNCPQCS